MLEASRFGKTLSELNETYEYLVQSGFLPVSGHDNATGWRS
jgi:hypothetical protein